MNIVVSPVLEPWQHASESIAVRIRWFGLVLGTLYVNFGSTSQNHVPLNLILALGLVFTLLDSWFSWNRRIFLGLYPLLISFMEALFIGLLCYFDTHLESPFRFYYMLSLVCCAIRTDPRVTYITCFMDCFSYASLYFSVKEPVVNNFSIVMIPIVLIWVSWAASSLSRITRQLADRQTELNGELRENQSLLESRIQERTRELQETQAQLMHQDKMAGFGLLAAGIAHEVGNPLTGISTLYWKNATSKSKPAASYR
jgi:two-component system, NtrC family, sensor kinase